MGIALYGVTLCAPKPWSDRQKSAVQRACRDVLADLKRSATEDEVAAYWQGALESETSAYWQFADDEREPGLLAWHLERQCRMYGMKIASHFSL